jgi:uncharacterized protein (DUF2164 family)
MPIELSKEASQTAQQSIQQFFEENFELTVGNIEAENILRFFLQEIAPCVYNKAVADVQTRINAQVMEVDAYIYQEEFSYWQNQNKKNKKT